MTYRIFFRLYRHMFENHATLIFFNNTLIENRFFKTSIAVIINNLKRYIHFVKSVLHAYILCIAHLKNL